MRKLQMTDREMMLEHIQADADFQRELMEQIRYITDRLDENSVNYLLKRYVPILEAWEGWSFTKKLTVGTGAVASALAAIGAVVWWVLQHFK